MTDIVMKIKRSEYLEMKRVQNRLAQLVQENETLRQEIETLKQERAVYSKTETAENKKKGANK